MHQELTGPHTAEWDMTTEFARRFQSVRRILGSQSNVVSSRNPKRISFTFSIPRPVAHIHVLSCQFRPRDSMLFQHIDG